jgi:photosystem II stability/assembly factor-like uncharacterized protein
MLAVALVWLVAGIAPAAAAGPDNVWVTLAPLPEHVSDAIFAVAVNPSDSQTVLVGTPTGRIYRSTNGGTGWTLVARDLGRGVTALSYNPFKPGLAYAGTRGAGIYQSPDGGITWSRQSSAAETSVRAFAFGKSVAAAGSSQGILISQAGAAWTARGLNHVGVGALAMAAVNDPARIMAGGDASTHDDPLPLYFSIDAGANWTPVKAPPAASNIVAALAAGPLPPRSNTRPLLMGTNSGAFISTDNGNIWAQLQGLPATDFNLVAFAQDHPERFYLASDGGATERGGMWATADGGHTFRNLNPPVPSITGLALSNEDRPTLYTAGFRVADHAAMLWSLKDAGGSPSGPVEGVPPPRAKAAHSESPTGPSVDQWRLLLQGPEGPFLVVGMGAFLVLLLALFASLRRGRL